MRSIIHYWYQTKLSPLLFGLLPVSWLFRLIINTRRMFYRLKLFKQKRMPVPVIVVGNITLGGTGKTPMVIWLASFLKEQGFNPGIVSRGVGGAKHIYPHQVKETDTAHLVGDEALLLSNKTACPLVIGIDRVKAAHYLLANNPCDIVISDDGLQHYRLARDIEIVMVDATRQFGNGQLLPAGPLRESKARLKTVDFIVENGGNGAYHLALSIEALVSLDKKIKKSLSDCDKQKWHAVAGIGHPEQFFKMLNKVGFNIIPHAFPDHHLYSATDLSFKEPWPIVMTEKDAVKCAEFSTHHLWYTQVATHVSDSFKQDLLTKLKQLRISHHETLFENTCKLSPRL